MDLLSGGEACALAAVVVVVVVVVVAVVLVVVAVAVVELRLLTGPSIDDRLCLVPTVPESSSWDDGAWYGDGRNGVLGIRMMEDIEEGNEECDECEESVDVT